VLTVLSREARPVAALSGRAKEGLLSRRRRSSLGRRIVALWGLFAGVDIAVGREFVIILGILVVRGGSRLAGVKINHRIKGKAIGIEVIMRSGRGEFVFKEVKIILSGGRISCE
jgi:hypothetical protein